VGDSFTLHARFAFGHGCDCPSYVERTLTSMGDQLQDGCRQFAGTHLGEPAEGCRTGFDGCGPPDGKSSIRKDVGKKPTTTQLLGRFRTRGLSRLGEALFAVCRLHQIAYSYPHSAIRASCLVRRFLNNTSDLLTLLQTCIPLDLRVAEVGFLGLRFADI